jgi:type 1 glutamine amidotransferase
VQNNWLKTVVPLAALAILTPVSALAITGSAFGDRGKPSDIDPVYGVCRGVDPDCYSDWGTERDNKVLVYSRTAGPRHANLGQNFDPDNPANTGLALPRPYVITHDHSDPAAWPRPLNSSNVAQAALVRMLEADGIEVHVTEDVQAIERLNSSYNAVIFMSPTRDTLWNHARGAQGGTRLDWARESLRKYIQGGGGFVGVHNAFGTEYGWQWYEGLLGNANYYNHGRNQPGEVVVVNDRDVSTKDLPRRWAFTDEWYNLVPFPTDVNFLATVDETTLADGAGGEGSHPGHGDFHPVTWCQYYDGGRSWVTTLGHDAGAFRENSTFPGATEFQAHLEHGIKSAMGLEPFCTPAKGKKS